MCDMFWIESPLSPVYPALLHTTSTVRYTVHYFTTPPPASPRVVVFVEVLVRWRQRRLRPARNINWLQQNLPRRRRRRNLRGSLEHGCVPLWGFYALIHPSQTHHFNPYLPRPRLILSRLLRGLRAKES